MSWRQLVKSLLLLKMLHQGGSFSQQIRQTGFQFLLVTFKWLKQVL